MAGAPDLHRIEVDIPGAGRGPGSSFGYPVLVGPGALAAAAADAALAELLSQRTVFVVTSRPLHERHGARLQPLVDLARRHRVFEVPDGEAAKEPAELVRLWECMLAEGGKRDSLVIAFGGGSVGDLAGFAAATFLRGIELIQVPTTLLAQVDSSVGGKTGIDLPRGKNSVGAFLQPRAVIADTSLLGTLPAAELRSGLVETIKMAALLDRELFERIEREYEAVLRFEPATLAWLVAGSVEMKAAVVRADPFERAERKLLNFGHTFGHALEAATGYSQLRHGEAVAHGIRFALALAADLRSHAIEAGGGDGAGLLADDLAPRLEALLSRLELPLLPPIDPLHLIGILRGDKKARESGLTWVLPRRLGRGALVDGVDETRVERLVREYLAGNGA